MAPHPLFPTEVFEAVIDEASDNTTSLRRLSLTCRTFLPRTRFHLFSRIRIRTVPQLESSGEFLDSHAWVVPLIRQITLSTVVPPNRKDTPPNIRLLETVPVHLLSRLPNLCAWRMELDDLQEAEELPCLSLHRFARSSYQKHGSHIRKLELFNIAFQNVSDFKGLVAAFSQIRTLSCSFIRVNKEPKPPADDSGVKKVAQPRVPSTLKSLNICATADVHVIEFLLGSSPSTLNNLSVTIRELFTKLQTRGDYFERLEGSITGLSQLSSLTLVVRSRWPMDTSYGNSPDVLQDIKSATRILERSKGLTALRDVRVEFKPDAIAGIGITVSLDDGLVACKALDERISAFPRPSILVHEAVDRQMPRGGRAEFWSPTLKCAFPKLSGRGLITLPYTEEGAPHLLGHEESVTHLVVDRNWQDQVVTASKDGTIIVWNIDPATGHIRVTQEWLAHKSHVTGLALSPDSRRLVSVSGMDLNETTPAVWDITDGIQRVEIPEGAGHPGAIETCTWSPDGGLIASASDFDGVRIWDARTLQPRDLLDDPDATSPRQLQFSPNSRSLAWISFSSTNRRQQCNVWKPNDPEGRPRTLHWKPSHAVSIKAFAFDPESRRIATCHGDTSGMSPVEEYAVRIWDVATGAALAVLVGHSTAVQNVSFSPDGRSVLSRSSGLDDASTRIWDLDTGKETAKFGPFKEPSTGASGPACFSPDGKYVATALFNHVRLWRVRDRSCVATFTEHEMGVRRLAFCPKGEFLISGDLNGVVHSRRLSSFRHYTHPYQPRLASPPGLGCHMYLT